MAGLQGRTLVTLEARMPSELAGLIERHGGRAVSAPAMREAPLPDRPEVTAFVDAICEGRVEAVVFLTGVGARAVIGAADALGKRDVLIESLRQSKVVCRGPKPVAVMRSHKVPIDLVAPEPYTSEALIEAIRGQGWDLGSKRVALQHYGEVNAYVRDELAAMGAEVLEVSLYRWELPRDLGPLEEAIVKMARGEVDGVLFTTQVQVRHLFSVAERMGLKDALKEALASRVVVAPVGPVCVRALAEEGVRPHVTPKHPKMGPLVLAVADYFTTASPAEPETSLAEAPSKSGEEP